MLAAIMIGRPGRRYVKQERLIEARAGRPRHRPSIHRFFMSENSSPGATYLLTHALA